MLLMLEKPRPTSAERACALLFRAARALPATLDAVLMGPFRALERRRLIDAMGAMSERDLRDVGLSRGDIRDAVAASGHRRAGPSAVGRPGVRRPA